MVVSAGAPDPVRSELPPDIATGGGGGELGGSAAELGGTTGALGSSMLGVVLGVAAGDVADATAAGAGVAGPGVAGLVMATAG